MAVSAETLSLLMAAGLAGDALLAVVRSIDRDNAPRRSKGAERQARYRERQASQVTSQSDVTPPLKKDIQTPPVPPTTEANASAVAPTPKKSQRKGQGTRLPSDFALPDAWTAYAVAQGVPAKEVPRVFERFRNHWVAAVGAKGSKADWLATWRNWVIGDCQKFGWAPVEAGGGPAVDQVWVGVLDPRWRAAASRYRLAKGGKDPPMMAGNGGMGWYFPKDWLAGEGAAA